MPGLGRYGNELRTWPWLFSMAGQTENRYDDNDNKQDDQRVLCKSLAGLTFQHPRTHSPAPPVGKDGTLKYAFQYSTP